MPWYIPDSEASYFSRWPGPVRQSDIVKLHAIVGPNFQPPTTMAMAEQWLKTGVAGAHMLLHCAILTETDANALEYPGKDYLAVYEQLAIADYAANDIVTKRLYHLQNIAFWFFVLSLFNFIIVALQLSSFLPTVGVLSSMFLLHLTTKYNVVEMMFNYAPSPKDRPFTWMYAPRIATDLQRMKEYVKFGRHIIARQGQRMTHLSVVPEA